jgi:hypothetical protein
MDKADLKRFEEAIQTPSQGQVFVEVAREVNQIKKNDGQPVGEPVRGKRLVDNWLAIITHQMHRATPWPWDLMAFRRAMVATAAWCINAIFWADAAMAARASAVKERTLEAVQAADAAGGLQSGPAPVEARRCEQCKALEITPGTFITRTGPDDKPHHFCGTQHHQQWVKELEEF